MPSFTGNKDTFWRYQGDEFGVLNLAKITQVTDDEGEMTERVWRRAITPDDDITNLATELGIGAGAASRLTAIIEAGRYPEAVAKFEARKAAQGN